MFCDKPLCEPPPQNQALPYVNIFNRRREKSASKGLVQPAATKACNKGGRGPSTTRGFDPEPYAGFKTYCSLGAYRRSFVRLGCGGFLRLSYAVHLCPPAQATLSMQPWGVADGLVTRRTYLQDPLGEIGRPFEVSGCHNCPEGARGSVRCRGGQVCVISVSSCTRMACECHYWLAGLR